MFPYRLLNILLIYYLIFIPFCDSETPKEYQVDKRKWQNPSDRQETISSFNKNSEDTCDCHSHINECQHELIITKTKLTELSQICSKSEENFAKTLFLQILGNLKIDYKNATAIYSPADVYLSEEGMAKLKEFLNSKYPSPTLIEQLQPFLKEFVKYASDTKEHFLLKNLRDVPFVFEITITTALLILFKFFKSKAPIIIFFLLLAHEVNEKMENNFRTAMAQKLSRQAQQSSNPCAPKSWTYVIFAYVGSYIERIEDPCDTFYKDALSETPSSLNVLSSSLYVLGKTAGSPFIGFFEAFQEAIEVFLTPAPIHIQIAKLCFAGSIMFLIILFILKSWRIKVQTPLLSIDFQAGGHERAAIGHENNNEKRAAVAQN